MSARKTHVDAETIVILMACGLRAPAAEPAVEGDDNIHIEKR